MTTAAGRDSTRRASFTVDELTAAYSANAASIIAAGVVGMRTTFTPPRIWAAA